MKETAYCACGGRLRFDSDLSGITYESCARCGLSRRMARYAPDPELETVVTAVDTLASAGKRPTSKAVAELLNVHRLAGWRRWRKAVRIGLVTDWRVERRAAVLDRLVYQVEQRGPISVRQLALLLGMKPQTCAKRVREARRTGRILNLSRGKWARL